MGKAGSTTLSNDDCKLHLWRLLCGIGQESGGRTCLSEVQRGNGRTKTKERTEGRRIMEEPDVCYPDIEQYKRQRRQRKGQQRFASKHAISAHTAKVKWCLSVIWNWNHCTTITIAFYSSDAQCLSRSDRQMQFIQLPIARKERKEGIQEKQHSFFFFRI